MRVVRTFYALVVEGDGTPPSASDVARAAGINVYTAYTHLRKGVEYGLIDYQLIPGSHYGIKGFRSFHPLPINQTKG